MATFKHSFSKELNDDDKTEISSSLKNESYSSVRDFDSSLQFLTCHSSNATDIGFPYNV